MTTRKLGNWNVSLNVIPSWQVEAEFMRALQAHAAAVAVVCAAFFALQCDSAIAQTSAPVSTTQAVPPTVTAKPLTAPTLPAPGAASALACTAPAELVHFEQPLAHTMRRLVEGQPLTIVAIGSSSTAGAGASSPAATYPSRLAVELRARLPGREITVLNRGVNGEETTNELRVDQDHVSAGRLELFNAVVKPRCMGAERMVA